MSLLASLGYTSRPTEERARITPSTRRDTWIDVGTGTKDVPDFNIPQVYTACSIYGNAMSSLNFATYKDDGTNNIEQERHFLTRLLTESVNPFMVPSDFFSTMMFHWGITGNATALIVRNNVGEPIELILLDPYDFSSVKIKNGKKLWKFTKYEEEIDDKDIFHIAGPGWNGLVGKNPIEAHRATMNTSVYMNNYIEKFYENGAHLKHVIEMEGALDDDSWNNFMTSWQAVFSGTNNAGKTAILEHGMKLKPLSLNPIDAAYLQLTGNVTKMVANVYRLPLYLFNEYKEGAQYDNVESQDLAFIKYAIGPMVIRWEQEIKRKLLPPKSRYFGKFDLFSLSRGDMKSIAEYANRYFVLGALNQDEIRKKYLNLNPLPDGQGKDYYIQGNNMVPLRRIDDIYTAKLQGNDTPGKGSSGKDVDTDLPTVKEDL